MNPNTVIDALGGTSVVAMLCDVTPAAVSQWRDGGIPKARLMYLQLLKPAIFADLICDESKADNAERAA